MPAGEWHRAVETWVREVDLHRLGDRHELRLRLVPEHLGPLHVELSRDAAGIYARITVGHAETLALIQRHLDDLRQALHAQGYELAWLDVGLGAGDDPGREGRSARDLGTGAGSSRLSGVAGSREGAGRPAGTAVGVPGRGPDSAGVLDVRI
ncbi:MAG: flagellar hook-length control protein FliK [Symbiobacteriaceae bacterium]